MSGALDSEISTDDFTIEGVGVLFSSIAHGSSGTPTRFSSSAFGSDPFRVPLVGPGHDDDRPLGLAELAPDGQGLKVKARVSKTQAGRDVVELVKDGGLSGFSISFDVLTSRKDADGTRLVTAAKVGHLALVTQPADRAARVLAAGGHPTPRYLHAAPAYERNTHAADTAEAGAMLSRADRDAIIRQAEADAFGVVLSEPARTTRADNGERWTSTAEMFGQPGTFERQMARAADTMWKNARRQWLDEHGARGTARGERAGDEPMPLSFPKRGWSDVPLYAPPPPAVPGTHNTPTGPRPADPAPGYAVEQPQPGSVPTGAPPTGKK